MEEKKIILSAAYLEVCRCKKHACIVIPQQRKRSAEFGSKERAFALLAKGADSNVLTTEEATHLSQQIKSSNLPEYEDMVDITTHIIIETKNDCSSGIEQEIVDKIQEFLKNHSSSSLDSDKDKEDPKWIM